MKNLSLVNSDKEAQLPLWDKPCIVYLEIKFTKAGICDSKIGPGSPDGENCFEAGTAMS